MQTNGRYLLDSNIVIALFRGEERVCQRITTAIEVFVPNVVLGELYFGARRSGRVAENLSRIDEFAAGVTVLICDSETARVYGQIKAALLAIGRPIPENDIWIAATAMRYRVLLVTRDTHFAAIEGLECEAW